MIFSLPGLVLVTQAEGVTGIAKNLLGKTMDIILDLR
jgi:hypothetical protein